jgi:hypothetical protein
MCQRLSLAGLPDFPLWPELQTFGTEVCELDVPGATNGTRRPFALRLLNGSNDRVRLIREVGQSYLILDRIVQRFSRVKIKMQAKYHRHKSVKTENNKDNNRTPENAKAHRMTHQTFGPHRPIVVEDRFGLSPFKPTAFQAQLFQNSFQIWQSENVRLERIVLRFSGRAVQLVRERNWHPSQRLQELADGNLEVTLTLNSLEEIVP